MHTLADAEAALQFYVPLVAQYGKDDKTLTRVFPLLKAAGDPHTKLRVVHIAGTSGKTSTAYYMAALLCQGGAKVGLTVSPHVDAINERLQINGQPLSPDVFCSYLAEFLTIVQSVPFKPSYFELLIAFAIWVFNKEKVDYAVLETGLGGTLDTSNVVIRPDKVCILTDIGLDHQYVLGDTISEIAVHKAGIMHKGNDAFAFQQDSSVIDVFKDRAAQAGADLTVLNQTTIQATAPKSLLTLPDFQKRNWLLAKCTYDYIANRDKLPTLDDARLAKSMQVVVPGRMQELTVAPGQAVVMDGAHNQQKMHAFVASFISKYGNQKVPVLLALKKDKYEQFMQELMPIMSELIITTFVTSQDTPIVSVEPERIVKVCKDLHFANYRIIPDHSLAFCALLELGQPLSVVTGSFYLLTQVRPLLQQNVN